MKKMRKGMKLEIEEIESVNKIWEGKKRKMKTKTKILVLMEIAIVLCSVFLMTLPAMANAAEEDDFVLGVYGNANEDDTIDMRDLTYVKLIFFGKKPATELADAKYDGKINPLDFIQIKLIIVGKEKELTYVDILGESETVKKPINRLVNLGWNGIDVTRMLDAREIAVAVGSDYSSSDEYRGQVGHSRRIGTETII
jgi:iron complex transport system substrate-binding protein